MSDLASSSRLARGVAPLFPGVDIKPLIAEIQARAEEELDYHLEAEAQHGLRRRRSATTPTSSCPTWSRPAPTVLVTEWLESPASLATIIATGTQEERDHYGELLVRFLFAGPARTGMLHADPHPGNFRVLPPRTARPADWACSTSAPWRGSPSSSLPQAMGTLIRIAEHRGPGRAARRAAPRGLRQGQHQGRPAAAPGLPRPVRRADPRRALPVHPRVDARAVQAAQRPVARRRTRWRPSSTCRPAYLLIHRTWLGGIGLLSQLEAEAPFRQILGEFLPGFADDL